jgi:hypothetical protein
VTNDVQTLLRWDLTAMQSEGASKKSVKPFKVCYQSGEATRPGVDVDLWHRTFGRLPEERGCLVCFMMSVAEAPFFMDYDKVCVCENE